LENIQEPYLLRLISRFNKKLVVDIRDDRELHAKSMGIDINQRQKCMLDYYLAENFEFANKIICSSSSLLNHYNLKFKKRYKDKLFTIINASDTNHFIKNKTNSKSFRVGFIGGLNQNSGINMLIDACILAKKIIPNLKLDIAYNTISKTEKFEKEIIKKSSIHDFIKLDKTIFYKTAPFFFNNIDILVIPLLDTKMNQMRTSNKLFDAMASGTPVIITDVEEQRELIQKWNIGLIADFSSVSLSEKIIKMYQDEKLYNDFSFKARKLAEDDHNWDERVNKILKKI
jgi:glycosyltransferase involved in cell wall biosynthesis